MECLKQDVDNFRADMPISSAGLINKSGGIFCLVDAYRPDGKNDDVDQLCHLLIQASEKMNYFRKQGGVEHLLAQSRTTKDLSKRIEDLTKIHISLIELLFFASSDKIGTKKNYTRIVALVEALSVKFSDDSYVLKFLETIKGCLETHVARYRESLYFKQEILKFEEKNKLILEAIDRFEKSLSIQFQQTYNQSRALEVEVAQNRKRFVSYLILGVGSSVVLSVSASLLLLWLGG